MTADARTPLGLFAGGGEFPALLLAALHDRGHEVAVVGMRGETDPRLLKRVRTSFLAGVGEFGKMIGFLQGAGVREAMMAGYVRHTNLFKAQRTDSLTTRILGAIADRRADTILKAAALALSRAGIRLVSPMPLLGPLVPAKGTLTRTEPTEAAWKDIAFGLGIARGVAGLDVGQTVVVKAQAVVAVEALEGTDATIRRAGKIGGRGTVVVKVARPRQDFRFDVPIVGVATVASLKAAGATVLAIEAGRTILIGRDRVVAEANRAKIAIVAL